MQSSDQTEVLLTSLFSGQKAICAMFKLQIKAYFMESINYFLSAKVEIVSTHTRIWCSKKVICT